MSWAADGFTEAVIVERFDRVEGIAIMVLEKS
jgi:hypothetical protein